MVIQRGEVWWASLPAPVGSGPGFDRPVVVIQADSFNRSSLQTVIVAIVTSNLTREHTPGAVLVTARQSGLPKDSVVNLTQIFAVDKQSLTEKIGELPKRVMDRIDQGLKIVLDVR